MYKICTIIVSFRPQDAEATGLVHVSNVAALVLLRLNRRLVDRKANESRLTRRLVFYLPSSLRLVSEGDARNGL